MRCGNSLTQLFNAHLPSFELFSSLIMNSLNRISILWATLMPKATYEYLPLLYLYKIRTDFCIKALLLLQTAVSIFYIQQLFIMSLSIEVSPSTSILL